MSISRVQRSGTARQLIVILKAAAPNAPSVADADLEATLAAHGGHIRPIATQGRGAHPTARFMAATSSLAPLTRYRHVVADDDQLEKLRDLALQHASVEAAYIKPAGQPPCVALRGRLGGAAAAIGTATPDFTARQGYLSPAPAGVDARYAWGKRGGRGTGVRIIDCEWQWNFLHEDLAAHCGGVAVGTLPPTQQDLIDHGTAVIGTIIGNDNGFGVTGLAPDAILSTACFDDGSGAATSTVIIQAADKLAAGDVLLLEIHRPGPRTPSPEQGQLGYIPIEWWPDDFHAILYATAKGILVVEAGGNGSEDLDNPIYSIPDPGFGRDWRNPFAWGGPDSGAVIVGAGNPPSGTHGRTQDNQGFGESYVDRARCTYSNFGQRVDCQAWGWEVTTLAFGDLQPGATASGGPSGDNAMYTDAFDGTSSASPIITGVLACMQGALRSASRPLLTPFQARDLLRTTGSPQQAAPGRPLTQHIGNRPDLREILDTIVQSAPARANSNASPLTSGALSEIPATQLTGAGLGWLPAATLLGALLVALGIGTRILAVSLVNVWYIEIGLVGLFVAGIGLKYEHGWLGALVDERNRLSVSRLQIIAWTILFVPTLLVAFTWNVSRGGGLSLIVPNTVWLLMGMAGVSAAGSPLILSQKTDVQPAGAPLAPTGMVATGVVVSRPEGTSPRWADIVCGDELGNATAIDVSKVQQLLLTIVAIGSYSLAVGTLLAGANGVAIKSLPEMDSGFLALIAAGHATYLAYKAVPHT